MKSSHRFPLRRQIVWGMRFFTFLTSLAVGAALFILSNQYVRANSLQAAEFNLRLVATSIETSLDSADALLNWASIDSTVRRYITQENINGTQTIAAYEAMQEKYYSSTLYSHILRFFVTNENARHLQFGALNSSAALNRTSVKQFLTKGYGMQFATDPLLPGSPDCIALSQPVRCGKGTLHRGSTYLALDTAIITDPAAGYSLTDGSALYWEMGSRLWQIENGSLTEIENPLREVDYTLRTGSNNGVTEQTAWQGKVQLDGQKYYVVKVTLNGRSAALVQLLPANTFLLHYGVYLWLVALGTAIIWGLSFLMQHWLERVITRPVEALQKRIETVGSGNFAPDRTVEWNNELGDIGRGINQLAENVDSLMTRRVEDERRKQELEYRLHRGGFRVLEEKAGQHQHRQPAAQHHAPAGMRLACRGCRGGRTACRGLLIQNFASDLLGAAQLRNGAGFVFRPGGVQIIFVITQSVLALGLRQGSQKLLQRSKKCSTGHRSFHLSEKCVNGRTVAAPLLRVGGKLRPPGGCDLIIATVAAIEGRIVDREQLVFL